MDQCSRARQMPHASPMRDSQLQLYAQVREKAEVTASHRHSSAHAAATAAAATVMRAHAVLRAQKGSGPPPGDAIDPA